MTDEEKRSRTMRGADNLLRKLRELQNFQEEAVQSWEKEKDAHREYALFVAQTSEKISCQLSEIEEFLESMRGDCLCPGEFGIDDDEAIGYIKKINDLTDEINKDGKGTTEFFIKLASLHKTRVKIWGLFLKDRCDFFGFFWNSVRVDEDSIEAKD